MHNHECCICSADMFASTTSNAWCAKRGKDIPYFQYLICRTDKGYCEELLDIVDTELQSTGDDLAAQQHALQVRLQEALALGGVGTEIHNRLGVDVSASCKCVGRIKALNERGPKWAFENMSIVLGWLEESAKEFSNITYVTAQRENALPLWRECVKIQVILPAIRAARQHKAPPA